MFLWSVHGSIKILNYTTLKWLVQCFSHWKILIMHNVFVYYVIKVAHVLITGKRNEISTLANAWMLAWWLLKYSKCYSWRHSRDIMKAVSISKNIKDKMVWSRWALYFVAVCVLGLMELKVWNGALKGTGQLQPHPPFYFFFCQKKLRFLYH